MIYLLITPLVLTTIILYWDLTIFKANPLFLSIFLLMSIALSLVLTRKYFRLALRELKNHLFAVKQLPQTLIIFSFVFLIGYLISPMAITKRIDGFEFIQFNGIGDYYKHLYTMVPIIHDGIPPKHPYFPPETMSYYFGFYTIPSAFSILFSIPPTVTLFIYVILVYVICLILLTHLFNKYLKTALARAVSLILLIFGVGVDVIPISVVVNHDLKNIIFNQSFLGGGGLQIVNTYITLMQSPQHFLAITLTLVLLNHLIKEKVYIFFSAVLASFIFLCSVFVSITLILWLTISFVFFKNLRVPLIKIGLISLCILIPFFLVLSARQNLLSLYDYQPYIFIKNLPTLLSLPVNTLLTFIIQYGLIIFTAFFLFFYRKLYKIRENQIIFFGILTPFILTWFIHSPDFNDFAMRTTLPSQILIALIFTYLFETTKRKYERVILAIIFFLMVTIGAFSMYNEYKKAWMWRIIIEPKVSELLLAVRKLPNNTRLAAIDKEDWVYYIPPLGFKQVLTAHLREAAVSTTSKVGEAHGKYEVMAFNDFLKPTEGNNLSALLENRNKYFLEVAEYLKQYDFDYLIESNQLWVKKDQNFWNEILKEIGIPNKPLSSGYTLFAYQDLLSKFSDKKIVAVLNSKTIPVLDKKLELQKGFWFLVACRDKNPIHARLEFEDYNLIFDQDIKNGSCVGNTFYSPESGALQLTNQSTVENIVAFPVEIKSL